MTTICPNQQVRDDWRIFPVTARNTPCMGFPYLGVGWALFCIWMLHLWNMNVHIHTELSLWFWEYSFKVSNLSWFKFNNILWHARKTPNRLQLWWPHIDKYSIYYSQQSIVKSFFFSKARHLALHTSGYVETRREAKKNTSTVYTANVSLYIRHQLEVTMEWTIVW